MKENKAGVHQQSHKTKLVMNYITSEKNDMCFMLCFVPKCPGQKKITISLNFIKLFLM